jgi:hypothetical protein
MIPLNISHYTRVQVEHCIASSVGNGKDLRLLVVVDGNTASYKVTNHGKRVLFEGASSVEAATAFNAALAGHAAQAGTRAS